MNFRKDRFKRNICPYCERSTIEKHKGKVDSFMIKNLGVGGLKKLD